jgi:hypothetical protein
MMLHQDGSRFAWLDCCHGTADGEITVGIFTGENRGLPCGHLGISPIPEAAQSFLA